MASKYFQNTGRKSENTAGVVKNNAGQIIFFKRLHAGTNLLISETSEKIIFSTENAWEDNNPYLLTTSSLLISGNVDISGNLNVYNNSNISGNLEVSGVLDVSGNSNISGNLKVLGNTDVSGNLEVSGVLDIFDDINLSNNLYVSGNTDISGVLDVSGNSNISGNLEVSGVLDVFDDVHVSEDIFISGNLTVSGTIIASPMPGLPFTSLITQSYSASIDEFVIVDLENATDNPLKIFLPTASLEQNRRVGVKIATVVSANYVNVSSIGLTIDGTSSIDMASNYQSTIFQVFTTESWYRIS